MISREDIKLLVDWWTDRLQSGDKEAFRAKLMQVCGESTPENEARFSLGCDYDPDQLLLEAVHAAGLECSGNMWSARGILPMKTRSVIDKEGVRVREGYAAPWQYLVDRRESI